LKKAVLCTFSPCLPLVKILSKNGLSAIPPYFSGFSADFYFLNLLHLVKILYEICFFSENCTLCLLISEYFYV